MLGQPASSQTVCSPSRRTSDLSSVYSGPALSRVLIHSGLRSIGTWLLRTSRRRSLRPPGPIGEPGSVVGTAVSVMISTVPRTHDRPGPSARGGLAYEGYAGSCGFSGSCPRLASGVPASPSGESVVFVASVSGSTPPGPSVTPAGPAVGVVGVAEPEVAVPGTSPRLRSSLSAGAGCAVCLPRSESGGVASPGEVWALEAFLPESGLGTGSSR